MNQEQRHELLHILETHITPSELDLLTIEILGAQKRATLEQGTHKARAHSFLENIVQFKKEESLLKTIAKMHPEIDLRTFSIKSKSEKLPVEPPPTPFIPFINRKAEWIRVVLYPDSSYYLFGGPAGYGKTTLLQKIKAEFEKRNWLCTYISLPEQSGVFAIIRHIARQLQITEEIEYADDHAITGEWLGKAIARLRGDLLYEGIALLLDVDHEPWESLMDTLKIMVEKVIPAIYDGLYFSEYFRNTARSYRVVLAGRYIASQDFNYKYSQYDVTLLKPFDYNVTLDICKQNISDPDERDAFAPHLLFYSGGHPRCMVHILEIFQDAGTTTRKFLHSQQYQTQIKEIAFQEAVWVLASIKKDVRTIFDTLCVYRLLDHQLLGELLKSGLIWKGIAEDGYELALKLKGTYLMNWTDKTRRYLSDGIVRRMLTIRLRNDIPPAQFKFMCDQAQNFYLQRLEQSTEYRACWVVEALFEYLQGNVARIEKRSSRQELHQKFLTQELPRILAIFLRDCNDLRVEKDSLLGVLEEDGEFRFTLNYYLRDADYDETPYQKLLQCIDTEISKKTYTHSFSNVSNNNQGGETMALLELLTATTVPAVVKFLFDQLGKITDKKIERDYKKIEKAKAALKSYQQEDNVDETNLEHVKEHVTALCTTLQKNGIDVTSPELFRQWSEEKLEDEELARIVKVELEHVINKAGELHLSNTKRRKIEQIADALQLNTTRLEEARQEAQIYGLKDAKEDVEKRENTLRRTIREARALIRGW